MKDYVIGIVPVLFFYLMGCASTAPQPQPELTPAPDEITVDQLLRAEADIWVGTPHLLGGTATTGIDCSALVQTIYRDVFSMEIPRTTTEQAKTGIKASRSDLRAGDLVFYRINSKTRHVGIYLSDNEFLHASESEGVTISHINLPYWQEHIWTVRRLLKSAPNPMPDHIPAKRQGKTRVRW